MALPHAYGVPLDALVGAPEQGDPRARLKPDRVNGRTVNPLTGQPAGILSIFGRPGEQTNVGTVRSGPAPH